jgi:2-phosphoglycerate kinase
VVILIAGHGHTGKTLLAQKLLERLSYPYLSIDHLKMGLIRAGLTALTPESDDAELTAYLWPVVREMVKTTIENRQNLIAEGCYIPFDFAASLEERYLREVFYVCLIFSERYIRERYADIFTHERAIEHRVSDSRCPPEELIAAHRRNLELCERYGLDHILIDGPYDIGACADAVAARIAQRRQV